MIDAWRKAGAEILPFSPLADEAPPAEADSCWLPGGYPELHAETLAHARNFAGGLKHFAETRPVHGECGGYMVLGESLEDAAGRRHPMTGLLGHWTSFAKRKLHLGYRTARLLSASVLGNAGTLIRGHEFHYASLMSAGGDEPFAEVADAEGRPLDTPGRPARPRHRHVLSCHRGGGELNGPNDGAGSGTLRPPKFRYGGATKDYAQCSALAAEDWPKTPLRGRQSRRKLREASDFLEGRPMPHRSNAELTVASLMPGLRRLNRPPDLGGVETAIFRRIVAAVPASHFAAEDMVLLCACPRTAALAAARRRSAASLRCRKRSAVALAGAGSCRVRGLQRAGAAC